MISMATKGVICYTEILVPPVAQTIGDTNAVLDLSAVSAAMHGDSTSVSAGAGESSSSHGGFESVLDSNETDSRGGC